MKIKYLLISALVTVVSINSCSSFLDEENISNQSAEAYFATPAGYESLVRGAYNGLAKIYNTTTWYSLSQLGVDISTQNNGNSTNQPTSMLHIIATILRLVPIGMHYMLL